MLGWVTFQPDLACTLNLSFYGQVPMEWDVFLNFSVLSGGKNNSFTGAYSVMCHSVAKSIVLLVLVWHLSLPLLLTHT